MKKRYIYLFLLLFIFSFPVQAKNINHFYTAADGDVSLKDDVNGSVFLAGNDIESTGRTTGVNFIAGNDIDFSGSSEYGLFAGNSIDVNGEIDRDVLIAGNIINIGKKANLHRDLIIFGSDIEVLGKVERNVTLYARKVSFKGAQILGNVRIYAEEVNVDSDTTISGKLSYPQDAKASISSNITNIEKTSPIQTDDDELISYLMSRLWAFMAVVFIFALLSLICPRLFDCINDEYKELGFNKIVETISRGLVFLIIVPVLCLMLFILPFGIPLSLIVLALYMIIIYLSTLFSGYLIGYKLWQRYLNKDINVLLIGILGYVILFTVELIPAIGIFVRMLCLFMGIGIITKLVVKKYV